MTKYRNYTDPYGSQDNQTIFRLFQYVGGFQDPYYFTQNRTQRIDYCAETMYPSSDEIDAIDIMIHIQVLQGLRAPRRYA